MVDRGITVEWILSIFSSHQRFSSTLHQASRACHVGARQVQETPSSCGQKSHRRAWGAKILSKVRRGDQYTNLVSFSSFGMTFSRRFQYVYGRRKGWELWSCNRWVQTCACSTAFTANLYHRRVEMKRVAINNWTRKQKDDKAYCFSI